MEHEHGEAFPREETRELVGEALRAERRRAWVQDLAIAAGLALLVLGSPTERLGFGTPVVSPERAAFLVSALCFALGWLVLVRAARRNGWESGPTLRASLAAATLPVVLLAATTPGRATIGWLGSCLGAAFLTMEVRAVPRTVGLAAAASLLVFSVVDTGGALPLAWPPWVWLAPLGWLGMLELEKRGRRTSWLFALALGVGIAVMAWVRWTDPERAWRVLAEERLEPTDLVLTSSAAHLYLLGTRHALAVRLLGADPSGVLRESVEAARRAGSRIVLDAGALEGLDAATASWAESVASLNLAAR